MKHFADLLLNKNKLIVKLHPRNKIEDFNDLINMGLNVNYYNWDEILSLIDETSEYALTGCVISEDKDAIANAKDILTHSAGNFYINDKPTGAVVGQQPFGGARSSGTNDKAGAAANLMRWISPRLIKETFVPAKNYRYPYLE